MKRLFRNCPTLIQGAILDVTTGRPITGGLTALTAKVSVDGGAFATTTNTPTEIGTTGHVTVVLSPSEMNGDEIKVQFEAGNTGAIYDIVMLRPEYALDSGVATAGGANTIQLRGSAPADLRLVGANLVLHGGTGEGQRACIISYVPSTKVATVDKNWETVPDSTTEYAVLAEPGIRSTGSGFPEVNVTRVYSSDTAAFVMSLLHSCTYGQVVDTATTTTSFKGDMTAFSSQNDFYLGEVAMVNGRFRRVSAYDGATRRFSVYPPLPVAPTNGSWIVLFGKID